MLEGMRRVEGGDSSLSFVLQSSSYFWEDDSGVVHTVTQAEAGEQGDPLMDLWNKGGVEPTGAEALTAGARVSDPTAIVWRGDPALPPSEQGVRILGTPLGLCEPSWADCPWNMTIW